MKRHELFIRTYLLVQEPITLLFASGRRLPAPHHLARDFLPSKVSFEYQKIHWKYYRKWFWKRNIDCGFHRVSSVAQRVVFVSRANI
jgi:hypothetical protein